MPDVTIIQMTREEISLMIAEAVEKAIGPCRIEHVGHPVDFSIPASMMSVKEICQILNIGRTRFEHYKKELIRAGMFKLGKENSSYLIRREDFDKWLSSKQSTAR